ncbi:MAG: DUF481 domain-containing protein, partial [Acidobacteriota bacterium]
ARELAAELSATGNLERGLIRQDVVTARAIVSIADRRWSAFVQPYWLYADVNGKTTAHELYTRAVGFRALGDRWFAFALGVYDHSFRREIRHHGLAGGGAGATLARWSAGSIVVSLGAVGELADYDRPALADGTLLAGARRTTLRASARIYGRYRVCERLSLVHDVFVMPSLVARDDLRVVAYGGLDLAIAGGLSARIAADASHEDVIVAGTRHDDLAVTFGVSWRSETRW